MKQSQSLSFTTSKFNVNPSTSITILSFLQLQDLCPSPALQQRHLHLRGHSPIFGLRSWVFAAPSPSTSSRIAFACCLYNNLLRSTTTLKTCVITPPSLIYNPGTSLCLCFVIRLEILEGPFDTLHERGRLQNHFCSTDSIPARVSLKLVVHELVFQVSPAQLDLLPQCRIVTLYST